MNESETITMYNIFDNLFNFDDDIPKTVLPNGREMKPVFVERMLMYLIESNKENYFSTEYRNLVKNSIFSIGPVSSSTKDYVSILIKAAKERVKVDDYNNARQLLLTAVDNMKAEGVKYVRP